MERIKLKITDSVLKGVSTPNTRINDTDLSGFHARINKTKKSFYLNYRIGGRGGKSKDYLIGYFPILSTSDARKMALALKARVAEGEDILESKKAKALDTLARESQPTVNQLLDEFEEFAKSQRKKPEEVSRVFTKDVRPAIGSIKLNELEGHHVKRKCLDKIRNGEHISGSPTKRLKPAPNQALKTERLLKQVFDFGVSEQWLKSNPLELSKSRYARVTYTPRDRNLNEEEIRKFFYWLSTSSASIQVKQCLKLLLLTGCRSQEMTLSEWEHIDVERKVWTFPAENRKGKKGQTPSHEVPLTPVMEKELTILKEKFHSVNTPFVFPSGSGDISKPIDRAACSKYIKRRFDNNDIEMTCFTPHDFRRTFCSQMADRGYDIYILDICIGHVLPTEMMRAYQHSNFWKKRTEVMNDWNVIVDELWS